MDTPLGKSSVLKNEIETSNNVNLPQARSNSCERLNERQEGQNIKIFPYFGTFQLTFRNRFPTAIHELKEIFKKFDGLDKITGQTDVGQRAYVHFKESSGALAALQASRNDERFIEIDVADKCKKEVLLFNDQAENIGGNETKILSFDGTYQLTFSCQSYVKIETVKLDFSKYGSLAAVESNFHRTKNKVRVFVKYFSEDDALKALEQAKEKYTDLDVARCCKPTEYLDFKINEDKDGYYCLKFRNNRTKSQASTKKKVIELFSQFGALQSVRYDLSGWCYIRYYSEDAAVGAYRQHSRSGMFPLLGPADEPNSDQESLAGQQAGDPDLQLFVGNYPHQMSNVRLEKLFRNTLWPELQFLSFHREERKAYFFAEADSQETMISVIRTMNGFKVGGRKLVVRAKRENVQAVVEEKLADTFPELTLDDLCGEKETELTGQKDASGETVQLAVANYPTNSESELLKLLSPYNPVEIINSDAVDEFNYSIVRFGSHKDADLAFDNLNGVPFMSSPQLVLQKLNS